MNIKNDRKSKPTIKSGSILSFFEVIWSIIESNINCVHGPHCWTKEYIKLHLTQVVEHHVFMMLTVNFWTCILYR